MSSSRIERIQKASRKRRARQRQQTRDLILEAAEELFDEVGYSGFSLRAVAERIGYTPTTIYRYFKDKDDLVHNLFMIGFETFYQTLKQAYSTTSDPAERLDALFDAYLEFGLAYPTHYRLMFMQRCDFLVDGERVESKPPIDSLSILRDTIQEGINAGIYRDAPADNLADAIWAFTHGFTSLLISLPEMFDDERLDAMQNQVREMCHRALAPDDAFSLPVTNPPS